ncbi:MAG: glycosyltransferase family 39 protein [Acidobacteriota bacterium]|nr:glycosyltransferase family 39 protein [Acidobacteriota bacterium]
MTVPDSTTPDSRIGNRRPFPWAGVLALCAIAVGIHVATAPRYGYFRDELYILDCGRRLDWGYVDHAPLVGLIARVTSATLGTSLLALRFVTGLSAAAKVLVTALIARELGAGRYGSVLAALSILVVPVYWVVDNQFSLNTYEPLFWMGCVLMILASLRTGRAALLLWAGVFAGLGLENKHSTAFFLVALALGLMFGPNRRMFRHFGIYAAGVIALALFLPNLIWQVSHGWPTLEFLNNVNRSHKNVELSPLQFLWAQVMMLGPVNALVWIPGLYLLILSSRRFLAYTYLIFLSLLMILHAKDYYLAPAYPMLFAAGAVFWERRQRWLRIAVPVLLILAIMPVLPLVLPILPPEQIAPYMAKLGFTPGKTEVSHSGPLPQYFGDQFGWPEMVSKIAGVYNSLPARERANTAIYAGNYGEASAVDFFGPKFGLPQAISAHNTFYLWGPRDYQGETLILLQSDRAGAEKYCRTVSDGPEVGHPLAMSEEHFRILVCHGLKQPLPELWPALKHWR